ncbi:UDP-3-O-(3-hydroxymyristoyl)glucosamine N-acyltransferase [Amylibacter sp.]|nr:UDP-3-O-(3-hydroxymyristoyl)glucosamine N-acyltransferase [Amylibacter sp.]
MKNFTIKQIADELGAESFGDLELKISGVNAPSRASINELALAMDPSYEESLNSSDANAAIVWPGADWKKIGLMGGIIAPRSRYILSGITHLFEKKPEIVEGIHPSAIISKSVILGKNISIGAFVVIGERVKIGNNTKILSHTTISEDAIIDENALIYSGVRIGARVKIGKNFICQSNTVIGVDGFSYVTPEPGAVEEAKRTGKITANSRTERFERINSLGTIIIGENVEIGANSAIDRGTIENTIIGDGCKLDNLVHIAHNVNIGSTCLICAQVGIAGSSVIGDRVVLGGQVGVADHISIGSDVIVAGKSGISSNVPSGRIMMGNPAMRMDLNIESYKAVRRLPRILAKFAKIEEFISKNKINK